MRFLQNFWKTRSYLIKVLILRSFISNVCWNFLSGIPQDRVCSFLTMLFGRFFSVKKNLVFPISDDQTTSSRAQVACITIIDEEELSCIECYKGSSETTILHLNASQVVLLTSSRMSSYVIKLHSIFRLYEKKMRIFANDYLRKAWAITVEALTNAN